MEMSAVILAGGKSSRMNYQNKALLLWNGKSFLKVLAEELKLVADEILVSEHELQPRWLEDHAIVYDDFPDCGPLSGIESGLACCKNDCLIVAACDMPMLKKELFYTMYQQLEDYDAIIPVAKGKMQPLAAIYKKKTLNIVRQQLQNGDYRVRELLEKLNIRYFDVCAYGFDLSMFKNVNTMKAYQKLISKHGG
jgi:molybdopterin-guanine dinucleotide biosynthesis protein A